MYIEIETNMSDIKLAKILRGVIICNAQVIYGCLKKYGYKKIGNTKAVLTIKIDGSRMDEFVSISGCKVIDVETQA